MRLSAIGCSLLVAGWVLYPAPVRSGVVQEAQEAPAEAELGIDRDRLLGAPQGSPLAGEELDEVTNELTSRMRCPVCQALSIADSPSVSAMAMKQEVRELLATGYTTDQIVAYFERSYGEFIRLEPKAEGFNLVVWLAPLCLVLVGGALVAWRLRRGRDPEITTETAAADPELEAYRERVRQEVTS